MQQLASGGIDGVLTSVEGGTNAKFWEHLTHFSAINYSMSLNMTHLNKDAYCYKLDTTKAVRVDPTLSAGSAWKCAGFKPEGDQCDPFCGREWL